MIPLLGAAVELLQLFWTHQWNHVCVYLRTCFKFFGPLTMWIEKLFGFQKQMGTTFFC